MVLLPQLWLNYRRKSSDGLSLGFILMWLAGDFADWYGAYVGRLLLPTILIALYFVITDVALLAQMFCYRKSDDDIFGPAQLPEGVERPPLLVRRGRRACRLSGPANARRRLAEYCEAERDALLDRGFDERQLDAELGSYGAIPRPNPAPTCARQPRTMHAAAAAAVRELLASKAGRALGVSAAVLVVLLGSGIGSRVLLAYYPQRVTDVVSQVFGYISAVMFFVSYIPQIAWNFTAQSTEGLSAVMFVCTVLGNVTFCLSILAVSTEREYLVTYAPWLAGALGTLGFEVLVLWQCYFYSKPRDEDDEGASSAAGDSDSNTADEGGDAGSVSSRARTGRRWRSRVASVATDTSRRR
ncbi:putative vacuolar membrane transporter for cationic amino acids [Coemansia nantahalensis]|nr:putative vacuolar membrane transporter for cationic amino acids [Coemansia nantahalensis]KAJ2795393.1 putative vacuolar membrane transporter for cationic amino acids [Coemansia helicoidea]